MEQIFKYSPGQQVWFMNQNRINFGYIVGLEYRCDLDKDYKPEFPVIVYTISNNCSQINLHEDRIFGSKDELIEFLKNN